MYTLNGGIISRYIRDKLSGRSTTMTTSTEAKPKRLTVADLAEFHTQGDWPQLLYKYPTAPHFYWTLLASQIGMRAGYTISPTSLTRESTRVAASYVHRVAQGGSDETQLLLSGTMVARVLKEALEAHQTLPETFVIFSPIWIDLDEAVI